MEYLPYAICLVVGLLGGAGGMQYLASRGTSTKEQALKILDKASKAVADMNDPGPDEQVKIAARAKREELLQASITANMAKINKVA